ncbi:MAG: VWA domain-containing protein [Bacteroidetes bacterium]|nr:VWA domain-containing protein [Bacteroidota bacterium]
MPIQQTVAKIKGVADIVFCIDATGSMQTCIDSVKANIENFTRSIETASANTKVDWRARVLAYRDFNVDSNYLMNDFPFVNSPDQLKEQLEQVIADGGGDEPESTLDAILYATLKSDWRPNTHKIIVLFTDATPLPHLNTKTMSELGVEDGLDIFSQVVLTEHRIKLFLFGQKNSIYEELSKQSRANVVQFDNAIKELETADFKKILETIGKTVSGIASSGGVS